MRPRLSAPWAALVVVVVAALAYSVGAQTAVFPSANRLVVKAVPEGKDVRSFVYEPPAPPFGQLSQNLFAVPAGKVFVVTDVVFTNYGVNFPVTLYENSLSGPKRAVFSPSSVGTGYALGADVLLYRFLSGIPFGPGTTVVAAGGYCYGGGTGVCQAIGTVSGYLADAF